VLASFWVLKVWAALGGQDRDLGFLFNVVLNEICKSEEVLEFYDGEWNRPGLNGFHFMSSALIT